MKKIVSIALAAVMVLTALALTACGSSGSDLSDSKYVGSWKAVSMSVGDESEAPDGEWMLTVNDDGTGTLDDGSEISEFTWEPADGGFKTKGDVKLKFKDDGDNITAKVIGVTLTFEKQ